jgi:hypothetical protein
MKHLELIFQTHKIINSNDGNNAKLGLSVKKDFIGIGSKIMVEKVKIRN